MFSKSRIEALSDGVFAITMTLLVLDLKIPEGTSPLLLGAAIRHGGHAWFSFVVTFCIASVFWTLQHRLFDLMEHVSRETLIPSFVFLFFVSILPFTTHILGDFSAVPLAFMLYFLNQFAIAAALTVKLELARVYGHLRPGPEGTLIRIRLYTMCAAMVSGVIAASLVPAPYIGIGPVLIGLGSRKFRTAQAARLKNKATTPTT